jgi:hypothetical protein
MKPQHKLCDVAHRLILHASQKVPAALSERLKEEWLADLEHRSGPIPRLRLATGWCWATTIIARDFGPSQLVTSRGSVAHMIQLRSAAVALLPRLSRSVVIALLAGVCVAGYVYSTHSCNPETTLDRAPPSRATNSMSPAMQPVFNIKRKPIGSLTDAHS